MSIRHNANTGTFEQVRDGFVIKDFPAYVACQDYARRAIRWVYQDDADFAYLLAVLAARHAHYALGWKKRRKVA